MNSIFWFRRDLRIDDNTGLYNALKQSNSVTPIFIFDKNILINLTDKDDRRVNFIYKYLEKIKKELKSFESDIKVFYGTPIEIFTQILNEEKIDAVYANEDYEPYAIKRDEGIKELLNSKSIEFKLYKDQVIYARNEVVKSDKELYKVFTPYSRKWKELFQNDGIITNNTNEHINNLKKFSTTLFSLKSIGFNQINYNYPCNEIDYNIVKTYNKTRNFPAIKGTSNLSVHLRFGTISIRKLVSEIKSINETFFNELIWREFFMSILWAFPYTETDNFNKKYDNFQWNEDENMFNLWCNGKTGYPLVDAGMRELNSTGLMHNRVRMLTANFLTKLLLIDWRKGEKYFAEKLLDYEMSSNVGNWQWAAGTGVDAAPYFRIFNPSMQISRFDNKLEYIKKWVPEVDSFEYPKPMINYSEARKLSIESFKNHLK